jgi:hypothetical protein
MKSDSFSGRIRRDSTVGSVDLDEYDQKPLEHHIENSKLDGNHIKDLYPWITGLKYFSPNENVWIQ